MEFKYDISGCSSFQRKSVESLYNKFFEENKSKLVLADEVGMGKTFVCKGLIENAKKIDKRTFCGYYWSLLKLRQLP